MKKAKYEFLILPYIEIDRDFEVGNLEFYSFERTGKKYIKDNDLYSNIEILLQCFSYFDSNTLKFVQFCDGTFIHDNGKKPKYNPYDIVELLITIRFESDFIRPNNWDIKKVNVFKSNDNYSFCIDDGIQFPKSLIHKFVFHPPGFLERINFKTSQIIYTQWAPLNNIDYFKALKYCYEKSKNNPNQKEYKRIITALKFRNQSGRIEYYYKPNIRIILISAAFEALFNLPESSIKKTFSHTIKLLLGSCHDNLNNWVDSFYSLRSNIVHGSEKEIEFDYKSPTNNIKPHVSHYDIAKFIFDTCLKIRLNLMDIFDKYEYIRNYNLEMINSILTPNKEIINNILNLKLLDIINSDSITTNFFEYLMKIKLKRRIFKDKSTTKKDFEKVLSFLFSLYKKSLSILIKNNEINNENKKALEEILIIINSRKSDKELERLLYFKIEKYKDNKQWRDFNINNILTIEKIFGFIQLISTGL